MSDQLLPSATGTEPALGLVHRVMPGILLFAGCLMAFVLVSQWMLLPKAMQMQLPGDVLSADQVLPKKQELQSMLAALDAKRREDILYRDTLHAFIREESASRAALLGLIAPTRSLAQGHSSEGTAVQIDTATIDGHARTLTLAGTVSGRNPGTLTVLASFADALSGLSGVDRIDASPFTRQQLPDGTFSSPFSLVLHVH